MTALTDFLLARITEDEAELRDARIEDMPEWWAPTAWSRERGLAECEAKRRIVAMHGELCFGNGDRGAGDEVLEHLAQVYSDHPDYDPTWNN